MIGSDTLVYRMLFNLTENASGTIVQMAPLPFPSARMKSSFKFAWQIRASEFRSSTGKASFSHSSAWTSPGAGNTAVSDWDFSGLGNRGTSRRRGDGGGKLGGRHRGSGDAAWLNPSVITHANLVSAHH